VIKIDCLVIVFPTDFNVWIEYWIKNIHEGRVYRVLTTRKFCGVTITQHSTRSTTISQWLYHRKGPNYQKTARDQHPTLP
jgi:hypothetical protein